MASIKKKSKAGFSAKSLAKDDSKLIKACRRGDESAWDELVNRYQRLVFSIPIRSGLSEAQAADIFQEVFLTLFQKLDRIEQPDKIGAWLVTTAKFKTWAVVRDEKGFYTPENETEMEFEMASVEDESPLAVENLILLEEQHLIRTALKKIDKRCQKLLSMIYLEEPRENYATLSKKIGVATASVSSLRSRCLKKLEKVLRN